MKVVVGILGVTVGLVAGLAIFMLGGTFGYTLTKDEILKDMNADKTEEVEEVK